jgi:hypothetical protein
MKTFLGKALVCGFFALPPISVLEGMWSDPGMREYARMFYGSVAMISIPLYWLIVIFFWCRWVVRDPGIENDG